jgi:hypothetical protein
MSHTVLARFRAPCSHLVNGERIQRAKAPFQNGPRAIIQIYHRELVEIQNGLPPLFEPRCTLMLSLKSFFHRRMDRIVSQKEGRKQAPTLL